MLWISPVGGRRIVGGGCDDGVMSQATFVDPAVEFARLVAGARGLLTEASALAGSGAVAGVHLAGLPELTAELFAVRDTAHALGTVAVDRL